MLVLTRKVNEAILLGEDIEILIVEIKGDQVKFGIKAPRSVQVLRKEIHDQIRAQNEQAAQAHIAAGDLDLLEASLRKKNPPLAPPEKPTPDKPFEK